MKKIIAILLLVLCSSVQAGTNNVSLNLQRSMVSLATDLQNIKSDVDEIVKAYFSTTASSLVGAAGANDSVTVAAKLTKTKFINGITMAQQLQNLFTNSAVSQNDYAVTAHNLINGSDGAQAVLSQDVEVIGNKLVLLGTKSISMLKSCKTILSAYNSSELAAALVPVGLSTVVYGADATKQLFVDGMNLCQQITNFYGNVAVTQGDWLSIVSKWTSGF